MFVRGLALVVFAAPALVVAAPDRPDEAGARGESPADPSGQAGPAGEAAREPVTAPEASKVSADDVAALGDASRLIDLSLLATSVGRGDLARRAALRAVELAPAEADAHRALAMVHRAAGEHSLARAQIGVCRSAAGQDAAECAALEAAIAGDEPAARLALRIAFERSGAPVEARAPAEPTSETDRYIEEAERIFDEVARRCVEVANWNYILVGVELASEAGPPDRVLFLSRELDEPLERCVERELRAAEFPQVPYHLGRAYYGRIDFEETGRLRPRWIWRIAPRALLYALTAPADDRALIVARAGMAVIDRPFLQPTVHLDAEIGSSGGAREYEVAARGGFGFARGAFSAGLSAGVGVGAVEERAPTALVVPIELWFEYRTERGGLELWARNTSSPAAERIRGSEHAVLGSTALTLGAGLRVPILWRGGVAVGIRYDERLGEELLGFWLGTELRR